MELRQAGMSMQVAKDPSRRNTDTPPSLNDPERAMILPQDDLDHARVFARARRSS